MRKRFKDPLLQRFYEQCRKLAADPASEFYHDGYPHTGASHRSAYWRGRREQSNHLYPKGTWAYAAYVAGADDRRDFGPPTEREE